MANGLLDLLMQARESGRGARADLENSINYYIPPELRGLLGLAAEANPVVSMERAGQDSQQLFAPDQTLMDRLAAGGRMASNMASVLAPMAAGRAVGMPAVRAAQEGLLGPAVGQFNPIAPSSSMAVVRQDDIFRGHGAPRVSYDTATKPYAVRLTGLDQVEDMIASGLVRPKPGGYGKQGSSTLYFGEADSLDPTVFTKLSDSKGARLVADSAKIAGREGQISLDDLLHVFVLKDGKEVDILQDIRRRNQRFGGDVVPNRAQAMQQQRPQGLLSGPQ
jgi:hypothetical protein